MVVTVCWLVMGGGDCFLADGDYCFMGGSGWWWMVVNFFGWWWVVVVNGSRVY